MGTRAQIIIKEKQSGLFQTIYHAYDSGTDGLGIFLKEYIKIPHNTLELRLFALNNCLKDNSCFHFSKYEAEWYKRIKLVPKNERKYERINDFFKVGFWKWDKIIEGDLEFVYFIFTDKEANKVEIKYIDLCKQKLQWWCNKPKDANHHYTEMSMDQLLDEAYDLV